MLILSRKVGERIRIGDAIEVIVQRVTGERVTLGLAAPQNVKILRGELEDYDDPRTGEVVAVASPNRLVNGRAASPDYAPTRRLPR